MIHVKCPKLPSGTKGYPRKGKRREGEVDRGKTLRVNIMSCCTNEPTRSAMQTPICQKRTIFIIQYLFSHLRMPALNSALCPPPL